MTVSNLLFIISILWIGSEIILARIAYSPSKDAKTLDRSSLRYIWITIALSVNIGVFIGMTGFGYIQHIAFIASRIGLSLIIIGCIVRWWSIYSLRRYFTVNVSIQEDHRLVESGIYHYIRHPSYAGSLLSFLGLGIVFSNWIVAIIIFFPILFTFLHRIKIEENALRNHFGESYEPGPARKHPG